MTNKLYYNSTYLTDWQTRVTETIEREDGLYVLLEETAFIRMVVDNPVI